MVVPVGLPAACCDVGVVSKPSHSCCKMIEHDCFCMCTLREMGAAKTACEGAPPAVSAEVDEVLCPMHVHAECSCQEGLRGPHLQHVPANLLLR
jgi:hypothetical protein